MVELFLKQLLAEFNIAAGKFSDNTVARLLHNAKINELTKSINAAKNQVISLFHIYKETEEFKDAQIMLPNAVSRKHYEYRVDLSRFPNICILIKQGFHLMLLPQKYPAYQRQPFRWTCSYPLPAARGRTRWKT